MRKPCDSFTGPTLLLIANLDQAVMHLGLSFGVIPHFGFERYTGYARAS